MSENELPELTDEELLSHATEFEFLPDGAEHALYEEDHRFYALRVSLRDEGRYAIVNSIGRCWDGEEFVREPSPSYRTEEFMENARFPRDEAVRLARMLANTHRISGRTYRESLAYLNAEKVDNQEWQHAVEEDVPHSGEVQKVEDSLQERYDTEDIQESK